MEIYYQSKLNEQEKRDVWEILCEVDNEFIPSLSSRNDTKQISFENCETNSDGPIDYFEQIKKQEFILTREDSKIIGFLSFINKYKNNILKDFNPSNYISTVAIKKVHRNKKIGLKMYNFLLNKLPYFLKLKYITTRTWSTNHNQINILLKLEFVEIHRLKDHRKKLVDTIYFGKIIE